MHVNVLERWESKKYFGFPLLSASDLYATTFAKILTITVPLNNSAGPSMPAMTLISCTNVQKLDNLLNKVKTRSLEFLNQIFRYIFEKVVNQVKLNSPFLAKGIQFLPFLVQSVLTVSQRPDIEQLLIDDVY